MSPTALPSHMTSTPERQPDGGEFLLAIWGIGQRNLRSDLSAYFDFCQNEAESGFDPHLSQREVLYLAELVKVNLTVPRCQIQSALEAYSKGSTSDVTGTVICPQGLIPHSLAQAISNDAGKTLAAKALGFVARIMLGLNLNVLDKDGEGFRTSWESTQSLCDVVKAVFSPEPEEVLNGPGAAPTPIKQSQLRAIYLHDYSDVKLIWTKDLSQHLSLKTTDDSKSLTIFKYVSLLEIAREALKDSKTDITLEESLARGCYKPDFILETLMTYKLLFPLHDWQRVEKMIEKGLSQARHKSANRITEYPIDRRLTWPATIQLPPSQQKYERQIYNSAELAKRYPYWGARLQIIYEESENPTPVTALDRWIERRKSPKYSFWLTFLAVVVAILFGCISIALAGVQIWIAHCDWRKGGSGCWAEEQVDGAD
ncbi:hypothetical protein B0T18DRAFT_432278 [Schizothecium vesticola]|uniref:Uncharacterized protein n=1 Tax=Schizothecium vesticola TaxID=314040 RepID=A0AA40EKR6_9PEZI|nr:hypothetical protein B0T18DRAFT_432278 [Schizothecium vesticola]